MPHKLGLTLVMALLLAGAGIFSSVTGSVAQRKRGPVLYARPQHNTAG